MKILIATDSFKGSLGAIKVCRAMVQGVRAVFPQAEIIQVPLADGGEGTLEALLTGRDGKAVECSVLDPLGHRIIAKYGILYPENRAIIEMAQASGLELLTPVERDPLQTTTYGTGQLIRQAYAQGCREFMVGIGGSATCDGGAGMVQALGANFFDKKGRLIKQPLNGELIGKCAAVDLNELEVIMSQINVRVAADVTNPLLGPQGAVYVYARQKGAREQDLSRLESNMCHFYDRVEKQLDRKVRDYPGAGAAGGLGAGLMAFLNAGIHSGAELVLESLKIKNRLAAADFVITGEGQIDAQTSYGKTIAVLLAKARQMSVPVYVIAGSVAGDIGKLYNQGLKYILSLVDDETDKATALENTAELIMQRSQTLCVKNQGWRDIDTWIWSR